MVSDHVFKRGKQGSNTGYDALDVLPFVLEDESKSGVGRLGLFECYFGESVYRRRPD